jgi:DNA-binding transcriptional regulator YhcF (GntR family)
MPPPEAIVTLDERVPAPPYLQIFEQIRAMIERGDLKAGDALPPVRQLAGDLSVAPNTVARAYADLKADGWIEGEERKLNRIAAREPSLVKTSRSQALAEAAMSFLTSLTSRGYSADEITVELSKQLSILETARTQAARIK